MVTLREWWSERWRGMKNWQQGILITLVGGGIVSRGLPFVERLSQSLSTFSQIIIVGMFVIGGLFLWNRRRIREFETRMNERFDRLVELQNKSLLRLDDVIDAVTETEAVTDGGESRQELRYSVPETMRTSSTPAPSTWSLLVVAILGSLIGFLLALGTGLGEPGSLPVTAVSLIVGGIAVGIVEFARKHGHSRASGYGWASREFGSFEIRYEPNARPDRDEGDLGEFSDAFAEIMVGDITARNDEKAVNERLDDEEVRLALADLRRTFEEYQNHPDQLEVEQRDDGTVIRPKGNVNRD